MRTIPIGALRERLTLQTPIDTPDGAGGVTRTYTAVCDVWAAIKPAASAMRFLADRQEEVVSHTITLRWRALTGAMRFVDEARVFAIRAMRDPDERQRFLVCDCEEIKP